MVSVPATSIATGIKIANSCEYHSFDFGTRADHSHDDEASCSYTSSNTAKSISRTFENNTYTNIPRVEDINSKSFDRDI